jgi:hypothetical protein
MGDQRVSEKLSNKQLHTLKIIFKFRFVTSSLLAIYRGVNKNSLNRMLQNLVDQKYIIKQYDNSYRIDRKGARFSLAPTAITWLMKNSDLNHKTLHAMYNKSEEPFVLQSLAVMETAISLKETYPDIFYVYSASEISRDIDFPKPRPHLYLRRIETGDQKLNEYFVELHHTNQPFLIRQRFKELIQHYDDEGWPDGEYPGLLFILGTARQETSFARFAREVLDAAGIDDLRVLTTTYKALVSTPYNAAIWTNINETKNLITI